MPTFSKSWLCAPIEAGTAASGSWQIPECLLGSKAKLLCEAGVGVLRIGGGHRKGAPCPHKNALIKNIKS